MSLSHTEATGFCTDIMKAKSVINVARIAATNGDERIDLYDLATVMEQAMALLDKLDTDIQDAAFKQKRLGVVS